MTTTRIAVALALFAIATGCGIDGADIGPESRPDGGAIDSGGMYTTTDSPPLYPNGERSRGEPPTAGGGFSDTEALDDDGTVDSCFNGVDEDLDGLFDCDDPDCSSVGSCRIGSGDYCGVEDITSIDFTSCLAVSDCVSGASEFGVSLSLGDGLTPGGDLTREAGLLFDRPIDPRTTRVAIDATFATASCMGACLESVAVGLTTQEAIATSAVDPVVGLVLGNARQTVHLVVGDDIVQSWPLSTPTGERWTLVVRPTGAVTVLRSGTPVGDADVLLPRDVRVVAWGKNPNRTGPGARIQQLTVHTAACDMPAVLDTERVVFTSSLLTGEHPTESPEGITVADDPDLDLAFGFVDVRDLVFFGGRGGGPELVLAHDGAAPALEGAAGTYAEAVFDPELFQTADGGWAMLFTAVDGTGVASIGLATRRGSDPVFEAKSEPVLHPDSDLRFDSLSMPTVARLPAAPDTLVMAVRAGAQDSSQIALFVSTDEGQSWASYVSSQLASLTRRTLARSRNGFDADEIAHPSLAIHDGAYRLYYAGRRGTRWAIGLLASDDFVSWRDVTEGNPLLSHGDDFDRLGATEPDVVVHDGVVELFYVGVGSARTTIGRASGAVPTGRGAP